MAAAASASSLSNFSTLYIRSHRFSSLTYPPPSSISNTPVFKLSHISLFTPSKPNKLVPIQSKSSEEAETIYFEDLLDPEGDFTFDPPEKPEGFISPTSFDEGPVETEEQIAAAYEELYGPAYSGESFLGNDVYVMDSKIKKMNAFGKIKKEKVRDGFDERVVQVRRVTKVVKGGKQMHFRAIVVVGDKQGHVGVGVGKAKEVIDAVQKSARDARRHIVDVPLTKYLTFPHRSEGDYGAAKVMLRPASPGTGIIAGGTVRVVLELAGVENALGKQLGSNNALNNARAAIVAVQKMKQFREVAAERGIPMEELWK
ncbi:30S ribosomal protein S5, chloroplastic [Impatiens glandulifera]|uniref:30S ribosomal protein S5, chloroplastic n=1 Tax=Impatiens glandulifera TaxID=253017 RepID=UPI001FB065D2|nr:30S ribosomal protein S5, chloroplastic [Impatiens glandulifera]